MPMTVSVVGLGARGLHSYIRQRGQLSYSTKKRQLQEEKEARLNKTPEKETRSVIKQSKAFVR